MQLSTESIKEFQKIYKEEFDEEITESKAEELGSKLVNLMAIICRPTKKSDS